MGTESGQKVLKFTKERKTVPVEIDGEPFVLKPMLGGELGRYKNELARRVTKDKKTGVTRIDQDGIEAELISRCLYRTKDDSRVEFAEVSNWPPDLLNALYEECERLNCLVAKASDDAKND